MPLAQSPTLAYPELVKSGMVARLIDLMSHENVDIVIDVVALLHELTDEDVGDEAELENEDDLDAVTLSKKNEALKMLIDSLVGLVETRRYLILIDRIDGVPNYGSPSSESVAFK